MPRSPHPQRLPDSSEGRAQRWNVGFCPDCDKEEAICRCENGSDLTVIEVVPASLLDKEKARAEELEKDRDLWRALARSGCVHSKTVEGCPGCEQRNRVFAERKRAKQAESQRDALQALLAKTLPFLPDGGGRKASLQRRVLAALTTTSDTDHKGGDRAESDAGREGSSARADVDGGRVDDGSGPQASREGR